MKLLKRLRLGLALFVGSALLSQCENVKPWERGTLADATMRPDWDPTGQKLKDHVYFSREAASGGRSVGGGGCGCN
jgi:hypothetical protein